MRIAPLFLITITAAAQAPSWRAGAAAVSITPEEPIWLAGYAFRNKPHETIRQPIFAKALAIRDDAAGTTSLIITLDLVGIRRVTAEPIAEEIAKRHGISRDRILFNASHTHSAPIVEDSTSYAYQFGENPERILQPIARYSAWLRLRILEAAGQAIARLGARDARVRARLRRFRREPAPRHQSQLARTG